MRRTHKHGDNRLTILLILSALLVPADAIYEFGRFRSNVSLGAALISVNLKIPIGSAADFLWRECTVLREGFIKGSISGALEQVGICRLKSEWKIIGHRSTMLYACGALRIT